jgi:integrase/recombinase XerD
MTIEQRPHGVVEPQIVDLLPIDPSKLQNLPDAPRGTDPFLALAAAFLVSYPANTARAYTNDLNAWATWCAAAGVHPFQARRHHVDDWVRFMTQQPQPRTGRPAAPATVARRLSCLSKFYEYGIRDVELLTYSPVATARRPKVSEDSSSIGLDAGGLDKLLTAAEAESAEAAALVSLLVYNGLRIAEALACDVADLRHDSGHRVLRIVRKGGKGATEPLSPVVVRPLEAAIGDRETGPIFLNRTGDARMNYQVAYRLIRRLARRAGLPSAALITPHSLRHSFATELLGSGVPLQDVQDAMGHADPRTTRRYDRSRHSLDRHATYKMAAHLRRSGADEAAG